MRVLTQNADTISSHLWTLQCVYLADKDFFFSFLQKPIRSIIIIHLKIDSDSLILFNVQTIKFQLDPVSKK